MAPTALVDSFRDFKAPSAIRPPSMQDLDASSWPRILVSPLVWKGSDFNEECRYILTLSSEEVAEIEVALNHFKGPVRKSSLQWITLIAL
jgi:hypothetical protein